MNKYLRYGMYQAKIFFREQNKKAVSLVVVLAVIDLVVEAVRTGQQGIPSRFPYILSIVMILTARRLTFLFVEYRAMNIWKFYRFFGYSTETAVVISGLVFFMLSMAICVVFAVAELFLTGKAEMTPSRFFLFLAGCGLGTLIYTELAAVTALCLQNPKKAARKINGLTVLFILLSESVFQFSLRGLPGKIMLLFPNFHIGSLLFFMWNYGAVNMLNVMVIGLYAVIFALIILFKSIRSLRRQERSR